MRPPTSFQWLIGNSVVSLVLMLGALAVIGMWLMGTATGWAALAAAILGSVAAKASEKVRAHTAWEREWNGGGGGGGVSLPRHWRLVPGLAAWVWLAWLSLLPNEGDPTLEVASGLFWLATALMAVVAVIRVFRRQSQSRGRKAVVVKACLPVPMRSPSVQEAYRSLYEIARYSRHSRMAKTRSSAPTACW
jgi:hypothetical protein